MNFLALFCSLVTLHLCFCARNELIATADCVCPGQNFTYECSIVGGRFTVWRGTVISAGCEITLFHSMFGDPGATRRVCNFGAVVGYNVGVENNCYTSKLDILVSPGLNGRTVECISDDGVTGTLINTSTLFITTTPFQPPTNVRLIRATPGELTFSWSPPSQTCPSLTFNVTSSDCGVCQNNTAFSNTTCRDFTLPSTCTLTIESIICGNLASNTESSPVIARLNVPEAPTVMEVYPCYFESDGRLLRLTVNFNTVQSFQIADGIDGSATFYTVIYSDSASGSICGSTTIPASTCTDEICTHSFDTSLSLCRSAANINITVSATNMLGNGLTSQPIFQDGINSFVDVNFNSEMKIIICTFLSPPLDSTKECSVNVTYGPNCDQQLDSYINEGTGDSISTPELPLMEDISEYCFTVTARSNNRTVTVEGTLNLFEISNNINGNATPAAVVPVVVVFGLAIITIVIILLSALLYYYQFRKSLIIIRFSSPDTPGSLAKMLKIFKDHGVNIICINTYWTETDVKWNLCGRRQRKENHVYISCTNDKKTVLTGRSRIYLEFIEDDVIQEDTDSDTGDIERARTVRFSVEDKPGALWEVLNEFGKCEINILGLNTRSNYDSRSGYKDDFVSCLCSTREQTKITRALMNAGALNVEVEYNIKPSTRTLQFYVKDEPGALANALKTFQELNINTTGINPAYMKLPTHDIPGYETIYVECDYEESKRKTLFEKLRTSGSDAIRVQLHNDQQVISRKQRVHPNYCIVKFSIRDKVGSLDSALKVYQDLNINIIGVNSFDADPSIELWSEKNIEYSSVQMVITSESDLKVPDLIDELQSSGHTISVECKLKSSDPPAQEQVNYDLKFLVRNKVESLAKALQILFDHSVNIISLSQERVTHSVRYVRNHIRFVATNQQEVTLRSKLRATGAVMDVETFKLDEHQIAKMKESQPHCSTTNKGDMPGNVFEREPLSTVTQV